MTNLSEAARNLAACVENPGLLPKGETLISMAGKVRMAIDGEAEGEKRQIVLIGYPTMRVIHRVRGGGKTTDLARIVKDEKGLMLCKLHERADRVYREFGLGKNQVMSWDQARHGGMRGVHPKTPVFVDDAESIIHDFFKYRISGVTIS